MKAIRPLAEFVAGFPCQKAAADALGIHSTQLSRWIKMEAVLIDGEIYTPAQRHRDASKYRFSPPEGSIA